MISIITTTYNASAYLDAYFLTLSEQKYKQFDVIIVDDGSTDNTLDRIHHLMNNHGNLDIIVIDAGRVGRANALNLAVKTSKHDWLAILDVDDVWHPYKLQIQVDVIQNQSPDVLATGHMLFNDRPSIISQLSRDLNGEALIVKAIEYKKAVYNNKICHSSVAIKKSLCKYSVYRDSQIDYELWLRLLYDGVKILKIGNVLTYKRVHSGQSFESVNRIQYISNSFRLRAQYALKSRQYGVLVYLTAKSIYYMITPNKIQLLLKTRFRNVR